MSELRPSAFNGRVPAKQPCTERLMEATASNGLDGLEATVSDTWLTIFSEVENQASGTAQHNQIMGGA